MSTNIHYHYGPETHIDSHTFSPAPNASQDEDGQATPAPRLNASQTVSALSPTRELATYQPNYFVAESQSPEVRRSSRLPADCPCSLALLIVAFSIHLVILFGLMAFCIVHTITCVTMPSIEEAVRFTCFGR
ncbi:hypothetical protein BDQ12DRAFT_105233 [Crucibulum laeve]|uniref:Uncharacterized protein n=1 Tax=Crucibulum laeve TaxID=68775 RepID=A0A5C3LEX6_9AGAR|nr:hypothetical protein BDQ12DRAFT_105233 [Crucibulum laeve]